MVYQDEFEKAEDNIPKNPEQNIRKWGCYLLSLEISKYELNIIEEFNKESVLKNYETYLKNGWIKDDCEVQNATLLFNHPDYQVLWMDIDQLNSYRENNKNKKIAKVIGQFRIEGDPNLKANGQVSHFVQLDPLTLKPTYDSFRESKHATVGTLPSFRVIIKRN